MNNYQRARIVARIGNPWRKVGRRFQPVRGRPDGRAGNRRPTSAFTLLELLVVMTIFVIITSIVVGSVSYVQTQRSRSEAERLASLLRSARQYAVENSTHTRVVFADAELEKATGEQLLAGKAYGAYAFFTPTLPSGGSDYKPFVGKEGLTPEFASMTFTSIPSGFVGQFRPLPNSERWRIVDKRINMVAFVPEDAEIEGGFSRDFLDDRNLIAEEDSSSPGRQKPYRSQFFYNPAHFWDPDGRSYYLPNVPNATYPRNYFQTPYPTAFPLITTRAMPDEPSTFEVQGKALSYTDLWPERADLRYFDEIDDHTGDYKKLGQPDSGGDSDRRFFDLRGIEFSPKGIPTLTWAEEVVFQFQRDDDPSPAFDVILDRHTGLAPRASGPANRTSKIRNERRRVSIPSLFPPRHDAP